MDKLAMIFEVPGSAADAMAIQGERLGGALGRVVDMMPGGVHVELAAVVPDPVAVALENVVGAWKRARAVPPPGGSAVAVVTGLRERSRLIDELVTLGVELTKAAEATGDKRAAGLAGLFTAAARCLESGPEAAALDALEWQE